MRRYSRPDGSAVLDDREVQAGLAKYFAVMKDEKPAKFLISRRIAAEFDEQDSTKFLWQQQSKLIGEHEKLEEKLGRKREGLREQPLPRQSLLDLKIELASRILRSCHFCTRRCGVDRTKGVLGYCRCGADIMVSSIFMHMGEEPELVPSGTFFTMGCTMRCKHCQNWTVSQWLENGEAYGPELLAREVEALHGNGCKNANLVGGEPTPWLKQWLETFKHVNVNVPVVWNSNSYYSPEASQLLAGFADVYLLDFKYGPEDCAQRVSETPGYWTICTRNHQVAKKHGEIIIRILVLPGHVDCCTKPTINWIAENLGTRTRVNLMFQYRPEWQAYEIPELQRRLSRDEMDTAIRFAKEAKLANFIT